MGDEVASRRGGGASGAVASSETESVGSSPFGASTAASVDRGRALPDFLIVGAMKSGTTSLYSVLSEHPDVFMPPLEVGFFDIDDVRQHPDFFKKRRQKWHFHPYARRQEQLQHWYEGLFEEAAPGQVLGERSTTYMVSGVAPDRIRDTVPDVRLIFMLRDPVRRAYSNYWHLLRSGEATGSFERSLRYRPAVLFERGLYREQIERYLRVFPSEQMMFLVFEEFIEDPAAGAAEVCRFLGVDPGRLPEREEERHENRGRYPWSARLQYAVNSLFFHGLLDGHRYLDSHLPSLRFDALGYGLAEKWGIRAVSTAFKVVSRLNCSKRKRPRMNPETVEMLKYLYEDRNAGLSELVGRDLSAWWPVTRV